MIKIGEQVPLDIVVSDTTGVATSLRKFLGSYVVLYAYPMDETPGCIKEACSIRDVYGELNALGVVVIGISPDDVASHKKFIEKHALQFTLLVDAGHELLNALGAWSFTGVLRTTFLIDKEGTVVYVWENVNPEGHGEAILDFVTDILKK